MNKLATATIVTVLMLASQPLFAAARVAVAHFASFADSLEGTAVDIAVNGDVALEDVRFKDFTPYMEFAAGMYTIDILLAGTDTVAITDDFMLEDDNDYTLFAVGNGITQDLELWALLDNTDMPDMGNLNLRIVHAAPFAEDLAATEVSIRTDAGDVVNGLTGVPYGGESGFFQVPEGTYNLKIASNDGSVNYIDLLPADLPAGADVTVFAVGDGINQDLAVVALPVGELPTGTPVDNRANGMWTILNATGYGMTLLPMPNQNRLIGNWYQPDGNGDPTYFFFDSCQKDAESEVEGECATPGAFDGETATTALYQCLGGGMAMDDEVDCSIVGSIDWEILSCDDLIATVKTTGDDVGTAFDGRILTRSFPCTDPESAVN